VVPEINALSNGSLIQNITIPYFVVDKFEWIQNPNSTLTPQQIAILFPYTGYNPYVTPVGWLALVPDQQWGPLSNPNMTDPLSVSETRLLSLRMNSLPNNPGCVDNNPTLPADVGRYHHTVNGSDECFVFAQVTYRAGVAVCDNCPTTAPAVIQRDQNLLTLSSDPLTAEALAITPYVGMSLMVTGWVIPSNPPFNAMQDQAVQFLSRSYQSAWSSLTDSLGDPSFTTPVQIAVPTSQADIAKWRVLLWVGFHLIVMSAGIFSFILQQSATYPWLQDPTFAVLFLDTDELRRSEVWGESDPWKPNAGVPNVMLSLVDGGNIRRRLTTLNPTQKA